MAASPAAPGSESKVLFRFDEAMSPAADQAEAMLVPMQFPDDAERKPHNVCVVIDISASQGMEVISATESTGLTLLDVVRHGVRTLVHQLGREDRLSIVTSCLEGSKIVLDLMPMDEAGRTQAGKAIDNIGFGHGAVLWQGLSNGLENLHKSGSEGRPGHILLFTDGVCSDSEPVVSNLQKLKDEQGGLPGTIHVVKIGGLSFNSHLFQQVAEVGGGSYAFCPDAAMVCPLLVAMGELLRERPQSIKQMEVAKGQYRVHADDVTPEQGVSRYVDDKTQGPACAIACGPATVYRNYFVPMARADGREQVGQTRECQINNLEVLSGMLGDTGGRFFRVKGGYTMSSEDFAGWSCSTTDYTPGSADQKREKFTADEDGEAVQKNLVNSFALCQNGSASAKDGCLFMPPEKGSMEDLLNAYANGALKRPTDFPTALSAPLVGCIVLFIGCPVCGRECEPESSRCLMCKDPQSFFNRTAFEGDIDGMESVLDKGVVNINARGVDGETALMTATKMEHLECVEKLLDRGADWSLYDNDGFSAWMMALNMGSPKSMKIARMLYDKGGSSVV